jgi:hypothetical protein
MTGKLVGAVVAVLGAIFFVAGATTWFMVQDQLTAENIVVADDAKWLAGDEVNGPFSAYAEADIINHHALTATGDKTYAELDREDPLRATAMNASFLRASLFTSVVAFGVAAFAMVIGLVLIALGMVVRKIPTTA